MMGCGGSPIKESTGELIDDTLITTKVKAALINEPMTKATQINVETFKGVVQLSGFVSSASAIYKAEELANAVAGVKSVRNDILLR